MMQTSIACIILMIRNSREYAGFSLTSRIVCVSLVVTQGGAIVGFQDTMMGSLTHSCSNGAVIIGVWNQHVVVLVIIEVAYVQFITI